MVKISEDYVSFETAKLLKKKGFPQTTFRCHYIIDGNVHYKSFENRCGFGDCDIIAPTLQMAMKWLREAHRLFICVEIGVGAYAWNITNTTDYVIVYVDATVGTYEEACEAAIKYCLEKLI